MVCLYPSPHDPTVLATNRQLDLDHILKTGNHEARSSLFKVMSNPRPGQATIKDHAGLPRTLNLAGFPLGQCALEVRCG